jgi:hypothetical protein
MELLKTSPTKTRVPPSDTSVSATRPGRAPTRHRNFPTIQPWPFWLLRRSARPFPIERHFTPPTDRAYLLKARNGKAATVPTIASFAKWNQASVRQDADMYWR